MWSIRYNWPTVPIHTFFCSLHVANRISSHQHLILFASVSSETMVHQPSSHSYWVIPRSLHHQSPGVPMNITTSVICVSQTM